MDSSRERKASCPDCGGEVRVVGRALIGEVVRCAGCGAQLEAASAEPLVLVPLARVDDEE